MPFFGRTATETAKRNTGWRLWAFPALGFGRHHFALLIAQRRLSFRSADSWLADAPLREVARSPEPAQPKAAGG